VFSPDEKLVLTICQNGTRKEARLWNAATGRAVTVAKSIGGIIAGFAPDGKTFAVASDNGVQFWDTATFRPIAEEVPVLGAEAGNLASLAFAPDGDTLALGTWFKGFIQEPRLYLLPVPRPLRTDLERIRLWIEVATWRTLDDDGIRDLDARTWRERFRRLQELGGPPTR